MVGATSRGMDLVNFKDLNPGQIVDFCIEYNNIFVDNEKDETNERKAKQSDFDRF